MCTVTLVVADGVRRLISNRDELHTRASADAPVVIEQGGVRMCYPRDPTGGGTWIGTNQHGVIATVLNGNPDWEHVPAAARSRGLLVPAVLAARDVDAAQAIVAEVDWAQHAACRLVVSTDAGALSWWWDGREVVVAQHAVDEWLFFTSSGLGDALVEAPRRAVWDDWFIPGEHPFPRQDLLHRHRWPERRERSINMSRDDARTVSCTTISADHVSMTMHYHAAAPDAPGEDVQVQLERSFA